MELVDSRKFVPLATAVEMIPFPSRAALTAFLHRHKDKFPGLYRNTGNGRGTSRLVRMISKADILKIQEMTIKEHDLSMRGRRRSGATSASGRRTSFTTHAKNHPLAHIFARFA